MSSTQAERTTVKPTPLAVTVLTFILLTPAAHADTFRDAVRRAAIQGAATSTASSSGTGLVRGGVALAGAGAAIAVLGATIVKAHTDSYSACQELNRDWGLSQNCDSDAYRRPNKPLIIGGAALAGVGAALITVGATRHSTTTVIADGRRVGLRTRFTF
jgi:hypothetical protein